MSHDNGRIAPRPLLNPGENHVSLTAVGNVSSNRQALASAVPTRLISRERRKFQAVGLLDAQLRRSLHQDDFYDVSERSLEATIVVENDKAVTER